MRPGGNVQTNIWTQCNNSQPISGLFALDHKEIKSLVARRSKNKKGSLPYLFKTCLNDVDDIIIGGGIVVHPLQFPQGKLPSMTSIIERSEAPGGTT